MKIITLKVGNYTGTAKIEWIEENQWSVAHYAALISVPFKNSRWESLFIYDREKLEEAVEKAREYLEMALERCTLF